MERRLDRDLQLDEQDVGGGDLRGEASRAAGVSVASAPGTITIRLSPLASTRIAAVIVGSAERSTADASTPSVSQSSKRRVAERVLADRRRKSTSAPSRAAPTAWFDPLPPSSVRKSVPITVSPRSGARVEPNVSPTP